MEAVRESDYRKRRRRVGRKRGEGRPGRDDGAKKVRQWAAMGIRVGKEEKHFGRGEECGRGEENGGGKGRRIAILPVAIALRLYGRRQWWFERLLGGGGGFNWRHIESGPWPSLRQV
ncbi:hypothetical protein BHE74_00026804 [Ensete ventricosum]|nr:hypothetical protein GW17_00013520 [Ensete ventricosum]RWW65865.1 hypothetical protein BHE74_00026804 [Ensete ventricosum]